MVQTAETGASSGRHFINIRGIDRGTPLNGDGPVFGKSPIEFGEVGETKASRKIAETLRSAQQIGILKPTARIGPGRITHSMNGMGFVELNMPDVGRMYYVHTRVLAPDPKGNHQYQVGQQLKTADKPRIKVISGPCLFSAPSVEATDRAGNVHFLTDPSALDGIKHPIVDIRIDGRLQPYEVDSILKLTGTMHALDTARKEVAVGLNIPMVEYWFYALDAYQKGLIDGSLLLDWFDQVKKRADGIARLMTARIPSGVSVEKISPLDFAAESVRRIVERGKKDIFGNILYVLQATDPDWKKLIDATDPQRFVDLGYLSYTAAHLKTAQEDTLPVVIENPEEVKIMDRTKELIGGFAPNAVMLGIFPHSNATLKQEPTNGKRFLYFHKPDESGHLAALSEVARTHQSSKNFSTNGNEVVIYENSHS